MNDKYSDFTMTEIMAIAASREIKDGEKVIIGTGLPLLGAFLAQKTHAPNMVAIYEAGGIDCRPRMVLILFLSVATLHLPSGYRVGWPEPASMLARDRPGRSSIRCNSGRGCGVPASIGNRCRKHRIP
jgi:hypothetical protein